jgi:hypothetical protein
MTIKSGKSCFTPTQRKHSWNLCPWKNETFGYWSTSDSWIHKLKIQASNFQSLRKHPMLACFCITYSLRSTAKTIRLWSCVWVISASRTIKSSFTFCRSRGPTFHPKKTSITLLSKITHKISHLKSLPHSIISIEMVSNLLWCFPVTYQNQSQTPQLSNNRIVDVTRSIHLAKIKYRILEGQHLKNTVSNLPSNRKVVWPLTSTWIEWWSLKRTSVTMKNRYKFYINSSTIWLKCKLMLLGTTPSKQD